MAIEWLVQCPRCPRQIHAWLDDLTRRPPNPLAADARMAPSKYVLVGRCAFCGYRLVKLERWWKGKRLSRAQVD